ncbi:MAG: TnpV protein [Firmicutes bacterium]|nr:TnpV protein [Bacillota bacterium]
MSSKFRPVELEYIEVEGILYPKIQISNDVKYDEMPLGKYGRMRLKFIKEHKPNMYRELLINGELTEYCHRVNDEANEMAMLIEKQYFKRHPIPEDCGFVGRVGYYNTARSVAEEVVLREIVYR